MEVLIRMVALVVERRGGLTSRGSLTSRGGRGDTKSQRPATRSTANLPNARTISELRHLAFYTKGDFPDNAHTTDCVSFVEYAYAVKTAQPNVSQNFRDAMKLARPKCPQPAGTKVISTRWVFKIEPNKTFKARLVAQGCNQVPGQDCGSTFALVCRLQSIRMVLAIAAEMDWEVRQLDVRNVFPVRWY